MAKRKPNTSPPNPAKRFVDRFLFGCALLVVAVIVAVATNQSSPGGRRSADRPRPTVTATERGAHPRPSATITDTLVATITLTPQAVRANTSVPVAPASDPIAVTPMPNVPLFYVLRTANARRCPERSCEIVTVLEAGETFGVYGIAVGESVSGSREWYQTKLLIDQQIAYVHSSLVIEESLVSQSPSQAQQIAPV